MSDNFNQIPNQNPNSAEVQLAVNTALEEQKKKKRKKRLIILAVIVVLIIGISAIAKSGSSGDEAKPSDAVSGGAGESVSAVEATDTEKKEGEIGDYICTVKSAELCKNWEGKDSVKITYSFTNNSSSAQSFDIALNDDVYQNGVGLEDSFISSDDDDFGLDVKIKPGTTKEVKKVYILNDKETPLEVEIGELISFDDTKITTTVEIKK